MSFSTLAYAFTPDEQAPLACYRAAVYSERVTPHSLRSLPFGSAPRSLASTSVFLLSTSSDWRSHSCPIHSLSALSSPS